MTERERNVLNSLTPIMETSTVLTKRDDLFRPFGSGRVNGGKLRQALFLMLQDPIEGVVTGGSLGSPQAPIIAAVANYMKIPCVVLYGGTTESKLATLEMPKLVKKYKADIRISNCARHPALFKEARQLAEELGYLCVEYGMNSKDPEMQYAFYETTANQVQNLPDTAKHLVVTCGSGITSAGILYGLEKYNKSNIREVTLVGTAPNREEVIGERLVMLGVKNTPKINYIDLYNEPGFSYDRQEEARIYVGDHQVPLHGNYEAKTYNWIKKNIAPRDHAETIMWIVGSEPIK